MTYMGQGGYQGML